MSNSGILKDKVVIVTGAGRGIGRSIALLAAAEGAKVVVNDLGASVNGVGQDDGPASEVVNEIRNSGGEAVASIEDITEWDAAQRIVASATERFGRVDVVINNAGILRDRIFHQMEPAEFDAVVKVHLYGTFNVSRAAAPVFRAQESGTFVHMTSSSGLIGNFGQANYAAAKMGVVGLSTSIALDMTRYNVRSNCISPAAFSRMSETVPRGTPEEQAAYLEKRKRQTRPEQVAPLAVYLASDRSSNVNGQIIGSRGNELYLYSQTRPVRILQRGEEWNCESIEEVMKTWQASFVPLQRSRDVLCWDPL